MVRALLDVMERCFSDRYESWLPKRKEMVPSLGTELSSESALLRTHASIYRVSALLIPRTTRRPRVSQRSGPGTQLRDLLRSRRMLRPRQTLAYIRDSYSAPRVSKSTESQQLSKVSDSASPSQSSARKSNRPQVQSCQSLHLRRPSLCPRVYPPLRPREITSPAMKFIY